MSLRVLLEYTYTVFNYILSYEAALNEANARIEEIQKEVLQLQVSTENEICELKAQVQHLSQCPLVITRFCRTDEDFRFYTRFPSEKTFNVFSGILLLHQQKI